MRGRAVLLQDLVVKARHAASEDLPALADEAARGLGAAGMCLHLVDHEQRELLPLRKRGTWPRSTITSIRPSELTTGKGSSPVCWPS